MRRQAPTQQQALHVLLRKSLRLEPPLDVLMHRARVQDVVPPTIGRVVSRKTGRMAMPGWLKSKHVFTRMKDEGSFNSADEARELEAALQREEAAGTIERIPVGQVMGGGAEEWYREKKSGLVYRLVVPDFPSKGYWGRVEAPEARSFFCSLCPRERLSPDEYAALVRALDALWREGSIQRARNLNSRIADVFLFHHPPTDETFMLTPPRKELNDHAEWQRWYFNVGRWPGGRTVEIPPPPQQGR